MPNVTLSLEQLKLLPYLTRLTTLMDGQPLMVSAHSHLKLVGWTSRTLIPRVWLPYAILTPITPVCTYLMLPLPFQVYTEAGQLKLAATSRQIGFVPEGRTAPALNFSGCSNLRAVALHVDSVLTPDPTWQVGRAAGGRIIFNAPALCSVGISCSANILWVCKPRWFGPFLPLEVQDKSKAAPTIQLQEPSIAPTALDLAMPAAVVRLEQPAGSGEGVVAAISSAQAPQVPAGQGSDGSAAAAKPATARAASVVPAPAG